MHSRIRLFVYIVRWMIIFADTAAGPSVGCPSGWYDNGSGQCYTVFTQSSPFSDALEAQTLCRSNSSELASIPDFDSESLVLGILRNLTVSYWTYTSRPSTNDVKRYARVDAGNTFVRLAIQSINLCVRLYVRHRFVYVQQAGAASRPRRSAELHYLVIAVKTYYEPKR